MSILDGGEQAIEDRAGGLDGRRKLPGEPPCYALLPLSDPDTPWANQPIGNKQLIRIPRERGRLLPRGGGGGPGSRLGSLYTKSVAARPEAGAAA